ncbi:MAG: hypothetical protein BEN18_03730 [Epulopiscium sp. Nuni2H_MBin001]|nr:MAG: hypothetical protein BEN18_03730 [Epulopiscium sp. Nuni2H_MBin001]
MNTKLRNILTRILCGLLIVPSIPTFSTYATAYDSVAPWFNYNGAKDFTVVKGGNFSLPALSADDDITSSTDLKIYYTILKNGELVSKVDTNVVGTYAITYYVEDLAGNMAAMTITVRVVESSDNPYYENSSSTHAVEIVNVASLFNDVAEDDWYHGDISQVYSRGLMMGVTDDEWQPYQSATRAQVTTILYRLEGSVTNLPATSFDDVSESDWFAPAVAWAVHANVSHGFDDGTFRPNDNVTREQLAVIMYNYAIYKGYDVSGTSNIYDYSDGWTVSEWAKPAMEWVLSAGIMGGKVVGDLLDLKGTATRAEIAAIVNRLLNYN